MIADATSTIERLSLDGPIGSGTAIGVGVFLAMVFAGLLWSQRRSTGILWAAGFLALRVIAVGLLLWMLLGPSWITEHHLSTPQSVAVLVDTSPSMDVGDSPSPRQSRWDYAATGSEESDSLTECECALVALRAARQRTLAAHEAVSRHQSLQELDHRFAGIDQALERTTTHLESAIAMLPHSDEKDASRAERILTLVQGKATTSLRTLRESLDDDSVLPADLFEGLSVVQEDLTTAERRLDTLNLALVRSDVETKNPSESTKRRGHSRLEQIAHALGGLETGEDRSLPESVDLKAFKFDQQVQAIPSDANLAEALIASPTESSQTSGDPRTAPHSRTDLTAALTYLGKTAGTESIRSAILLTDGRHNAVDAVGPQQAATALAGIPVHVVPIGNSEEPRDVLLLRANAPTSVFENDSILIDVIATAVGCSGETTKLTLRRNGKAIDEQPLTFENDRTDVRTTFQVPADAVGRHEFELSIDPLDDEADLENNVAVLPVNVVKDTLRVLLADGIARWEYRYLDQLFRRDTSVEFERLLFEPDVRATGDIAQTGTLPQDVDGWGRYDVVILGDVKSEHLDAASQRSLDEFVRQRGGNLVVIAGKEHMPAQFADDPLMELLPVESGRKHDSSRPWNLLPTPAAMNHPALTLADSWPDSQRLWKEPFEAQPLYSVSDYSRPKPTAQSLLAVVAPGQTLEVNSGSGRSPDHALLCWHQVGAGRVVYLAAPVTYRLRFRHGDRYHHRFWGQLLRWLTAAERGIGTQTVRISTDRIHYGEEDQVAVTVWLVDSDESPVVDVQVGATAIGVDGSATTVNLIADDNVPGRYLGQFANLMAGAYQIIPTGAAVERHLADANERTLAQAEIQVIEAGNPELVDTRCNLALLRQVAELTGGQVVPPTALAEILALSTAALESTERVESEPLWNRWSLLVIAFACLCTEWIARRRLGLL